MNVLHDLSSTFLTMWLAAFGDVVDAPDGVSLHDLRHCVLPRRAVNALWYLSVQPRVGLLVLMWCIIVRRQIR